MKPMVVVAVVATAVCLCMLWLVGAFSDRPAEPVLQGAVVSDATSPPGSPTFSVTNALIEDTWVNASRGAGSDIRTLTDESTSMCFLTKVEISGVQSPDDTNSCAIEVDDFTGFWQLIATVEEGGRSEVRCNARCLTWETRSTE